MWGTGVTMADVNFEWPTQQQLDRMPADVFLKSIEFKGHDASANDCAINSVRCTLSDNTISPLFEIEKAHHNPKTINFDSQRLVKRVEASQNSSAPMKITFFDAQNSKIDEWYYPSD